MPGFWTEPEIDQVRTLISAEAGIYASRDRVETVLNAAEQVKPRVISKPKPTRVYCQDYVEGHGLLTIACNNWAKEGYRLHSVVPIGDHNTFMLLFELANEGQNHA